MNVKRLASEAMGAKIEERNEFSSDTRQEYLAKLLHQAENAGAKTQYFLASLLQQESVRRGNSWDEFVSLMLYDHGARIKNAIDRGYQAKSLSEKQIEIVARNLAHYVGREAEQIESPAMHARPYYEEMIALEK